MMLLILFSTVGFNIISTFCDGCQVEHTSIALSMDIHDQTCECCSDDTAYDSCCSSTQTHRDEHHQTKSTFAKLKFDSPEAKAKSLHFNAPVFLQLFVSVFFKTLNYKETAETIALQYNSPPPLGGRAILSNICILRN